VPRHTSAAFVEFLSEIVDSQPRHREIHVILDNLSTHKTRAVETFLTEHPQLHLHFTPTYSSWLNQVELWFGRIERDLLARGIFTSVNDLSRAKSVATFDITTMSLNRFAGATVIHRGASPVVHQPVQATSSSRLEVVESSDTQLLRANPRVALHRQLRHR
jgi:transposase